MSCHRCGGYNRLPDSPYCPKCLIDYLEGNRDKDGWFWAIIAVIVLSWAILAGMQIGKYVARDRAAHAMRADGF